MTKGKSRIPSAKQASGGQNRVALPKGAARRSDDRRTPRREMTSATALGESVGESGSTNTLTVARGSPAMPELMTVKEVCLWTKKTDRTVRNWMKKGYLRPIRIGRTIFFRRDEVEALLQRD